ncbi:MAG: acyloxyacyl hydrolase [Pseudomonadales bacterium]|nr:acyloxyacyl hydrolase [Pseudomonadales bacterium]
MSEKTVLGEDAPEDFEELDVSANFRLPWHNFLTENLGADMRLMASAGILRGAGDNALVLSVIPEFVLKSDSGRFGLDFGVGGVFTSQYEFGSQDFGGPFQFAITLGLSAPLYEKIGVGYRFMHYSDAGLNGPGTTGIDFHMIEFSYSL